ncbi:MAG: helix-hairpin-helix domain-containing protein [Bacteroidota bacterium]
MKVKLKIFLFVTILLILSVKGYSQKPSKDDQKAIEDLIETIASNSDEELDYTTLFDDLNNFLNNPIDINNTNADELAKLEILTDYQINNLLLYIERHSPVLSVYELLLIDGFNRMIIEKILPFFSFYEKPPEIKKNIPLRNYYKYGKHQILLRTQQVIEEQKGFSDITDSAYALNYNSRYLGSPQKIYTKYKYQYKNKLMWGITAEKDAGELFFKNNLPSDLKDSLSGYVNNGFDFYSAHLQVNDLGPVKKLTVGDYQMQFGQGLTAWSGVSYGKSPLAINIKKKAQGIRKYSSTDENLFMRGIGTTVRIKNLDVTGFFSRKKIDANVTLLDTISEEVVEVSSFQITGLHSIPNEILDKHKVTEMVYGGNLTYNQNIYKVGLTFLQYEFDKKLSKVVEPYNQYEFSGNSNFNIGLDYQLNYKNLNFFGEVAISENMSKAYINGLIVYLHSQVSLSVLHRYFEKDYQSYYGSAFSEGSTVANEQGLYIGTEIFPIKKWKISAYIDNYKFPWLRYRIDAPASGFDYFVQVDYKPDRNVEMYWRIKQEIKPQNLSDEVQSVPNLIDVNTIKLRYQISYSLSKTLELKNRIEISQYKKELPDFETGYLIYQDVIYKPEKIPLSLAFRYAVFDSDSWETRLYAYENDILYAFSIPAYYSKGMRTYLTLKYSVFENLDIWLRYAVTYYTNLDVISSGLTEIQGNKKSEVKIQLRYKF